MTATTLATPGSTSPSANEALETLWELIKDIRFGMLTHRNAQGMLESHPLTVQNKDMHEGATLYFFIPNSGNLYTALQMHPEVCVSFAHPGDDSYVSVSGRASFSDDLALKEALWSPVAKAWFSEGPTDPDLTVLVVQLEHGQYWNVEESKLTQLFKMAKAAITGEEAQVGEHRELRFR